MVLNPAGVAFVTGAGGSVGRATILQLARDGVRKIGGLDVVQAGLDGTAKELRALAPDAEFLPLVANLTNEAEVRTAFEKLVAHYGRIDYAVNCAGVGHTLTKTGEASAADLDRVVDINIKGVWYCERLELAQMVKQEPLPVKDALEGRTPVRGAIVNVSSVLGYLSMPLLGIYNLSKHAILGLTRTDALDYARSGIRVNAVCPGFIDTPLLLDSTRKTLAPSIEKTAMGRLATAQEVADGIVFLCSDRASYITGISLPIDGGYSTH